ncbi:MAG TPA: hypothetical protein VN715_06930 [Roseiarcus sp.]|nr:hypothetical protein [Roseiarcus sp.]
MKTATAQNGRASERSAHKIAEKMAKSAGVDFDDWIAAAIAEYAEDLGIDPQELNERERLEAIEERIDRLARKAPAPAPARGAPPSDGPPPSRREAVDRFAVRDESPRRRRDEPVDEPHQARQPTPQRPAEPDFAEPDPLERAVARIERRAQRAPERQPERARNRLEDAIQEIERRAERSERRAAQALESLSSLIEARGEDGRLEETVQEIEKRTERNERRAAQALESLTGLVEAHGGENERLQRAITEVEARAEKTAARTARALETLSGAVEARKADRDRLESAIARIGRRAEQSEAHAARALESLATQVQQPAAPPPEREDPVAARLDALARRAARPPAPPAAKPGVETAAAPAEDDETFRLVAERLARRRRQRQEATPESKPEPATAEAASDAAVAEMQRHLRRLADKVETLVPAAPEGAPAAEKDGATARIERQLAELAERMERLAQPASAPKAAAPGEPTPASAERGAGAMQNVERRLDELGARVEAAARRPAPDTRPLEELARRVEAIRAAIERQGAVRPENAAFAAALTNLNDKLDRATLGGAQSAATITALHGLAGRLEEALQRPATATLDPRPIEELSRRIEGVRGLVERQSSLVPKVEEITAAVGELQQKLPRAAATSAEIERLEAGLRQLSGEVQALGRAEPVDMRPVEALGRRIEDMRRAVESQQAFQPQVERLEVGLAEIRARLERPAQNPQIEAVDATLRKLAAKFEQAANRPAQDPRPIEELSRRIDAVRGVAERGFAPHAARLEAALTDIRAQFDKPAPEVDAALRELAAKIEEAISRPATVSLDPRPIEELARRIESVRESLDRPAALGPQAERLESALGAVAERLDRAQPSIDAQGINSTLAAMNARLEEAFRRPSQIEIDRAPIDALSARVDAVRKTVERQAEQFDIVGRPIDELGRRLETLREAVERQSGQFDGDRLEEALRGAAEKLGRPNVGPEEFRAVVSAIQALATKIDDGSALAGARVEDLLARVADRLDRPSLELPGLDLIDAIADLSAKIDRPAPDLSRIEALMEQATSRLDPPADLLTVADAIADLSARLDRDSGAPRAALLEEMVQDVAARLEGIENKLDARSSDAPPSDDGLAHLELGMRELAERIGDFGGVAQGLRALQDRIDDIEPPGASGVLVEQTAQAIARDLATRLPAANPEALLGHLQDIHERLDAIASVRPGPAALEQAMIELTEELEAFRSAREAVGRGAATLSEMRAEQMQFDRRLDARFSGVQEILEKLVEKLDRDLDAEPPPRAPTLPPAATSRAAMLNIPDRGAGERRPMTAPSPEAPQIAAQARGREAAEGNSAKTAAINAHIAAARRAANAAADTDQREEFGQIHQGAQRPSGSLGERATTLFSQHRRPVLLGVAGVMTLLTGVAVLEMRGHAPERKSELAVPASPLARTAPPAERAATDTTPTGSIAPPPKVIAAPLAAAPKAETANKPTAALVAALPTAFGGALATAGANGDLGAQVEIAQRYLEGRGVARDPKAAAGWMQAAADGGNAFAQYRLGAMYEKGIGVAREAAKARALYKKAAAAGNARAMHNLAVLYAQDGGDGKPDYAAAIDWFRKAGAYGVRDSQFNLGVLYGRGLGAAQNLAESWMWFSLAARQGDPDAAKKRDEVENRMDGRVLAQAKKLLGEFKTKTPAPAANDAPPAPAAAAASAPPAEAKAAGVKG